MQKEKIWNPSSGKWALPPKLHPAGHPFCLQIFKGAELTGYPTGGRKELSYSFLTKFIFLLKV